MRTSDTRFIHSDEVAFGAKMTKFYISVCEQITDTNDNNYSKYVPFQGLEFNFLTMSYGCISINIIAGGFLLILFLYNKNTKQKTKKNTQKTNKQTSKTKQF